MNIYQPNLQAYSAINLFSFSSSHQIRDLGFKKQLVDYGCTFGLYNQIYQVLSLIYRVIEKRNSILWLVGGHAKNTFGYLGDLDLWIFSKHEQFPILGNILDRINDIIFEPSFKIYSRERKGSYKLKIFMRHDRSEDLIKIIDLHETTFESYSILEHMRIITDNYSTCGSAVVPFKLNDCRRQICAVFNSN